MRMTMNRSKSKSKVEFQKYAFQSKVDHARLRAFSHAWSLPVT